MNKCGYFFKVKSNSPAVCLKSGNTFLSTPYAKTPSVSLCDDANTVNKFVVALAQNARDDAKVYISKNFLSGFNLDELTTYFHKSVNYKQLVKVEFGKEPKNCKTNSIVLLNGANGEKLTSIIHLHMVKEPDRFSTWKIYGIEKE